MLIFLSTSYYLLPLILYFLYYSTIAKSIKKGKKSSKKALYHKCKALLGVKDTEYYPKGYIQKKSIKKECTKESSEEESKEEQDKEDKSEQSNNRDKSNTNISCIVLESKVL